MNTPSGQRERESAGKKWGKRALIVATAVGSGAVAILADHCDDCDKGKKGPAPVSETQKDSHRRFLAATPEYTAEADAEVPYDAEADGFATDGGQPQVATMTYEETCAELRDSLTAGEKAQVPAGIGIREEVPLPEQKTTGDLLVAVLNRFDVNEQ